MRRKREEGGTTWPRLFTPLPHPPTHTPFAVRRAGGAGPVSPENGVQIFGEDQGPDGLKKSRTGRPRLVAAALAGRGDLAAAVALGARVLGSKAVTVLSTALASLIRVLTGSTVYLALAVGRWEGEVVDRDIGGWRGEVMLALGSVPRSAGVHIGTAFASCS